MFTQPSPADGATCAARFDVASRSTYTILVNERSGCAESGRRNEIGEAFSQAGLAARLVVVDGANVIDEAERAARAGDVIVAAGGDGTVSSVAAVAVASGATLGVLPLGTLNHFARDAGIPTTLPEAVRTIADGYARDLDVGESNGRVFVNNVSLGLYPRLVWERERERRHGRGKWTAFAIAIARTWRGYRTMTVRMSLDGVERIRRTPFVFIGNGEYVAEGLGLGTRALVGGHLSVYTAPECGAGELVAMPMRALLKRLKPVELEVSIATDIAIDTAHATVSVAFDGELRAAHPPLRFAIRRQALRTLLPCRM
jgi:diacylglycerol kinase family enzyme